MVSPSRRLTTVALATVVLFLGLGIAPAMAGAESSFVNKINAERASRGRDALQVYWDLTDDARAHARNMMKRGEVFTNSNIGSATTGWKALGEIVGAGPSVGLLFDAFMSSSSSRSTILGGSYNYIGVGVSTDDDGILWVAMILMNGPDGLVGPPPAATTTTSTTSTVPPPTPPTTAESPATTTSTHQPSATTVPPAAIAGTEKRSATAEPPAISTTTQAPSPTPGIEPPSPTASATSPATRTVSSATTTTKPAPAVGEGPLDPVEGTDTGEDRGILTGGLMVFGLIAFAGGGLILFSRTGKEGRTGEVEPAKRTPATAFETCTSCGLVFDQQKRSGCPKCGAPT